MTSKKVYKYSKIPMALLQVKFCKESWSSLSNQFFVCQKRLVLCQSLRCSFNFRVPRTAVVENPKAGSDPMYSTAAACLANLSASSLLSVLLRPKTHSNLTQLCIETSVTACMVSRTSCDVVLAAAKALSAALVSEH